VRTEQFIQIMPKARQRAGLFVPALNAAMAEFGISTPPRQAAFLATVAHESGQLSVFEENLNYSSAALAKVWPSRFPPPLAAVYARQPERIANRAYASREGNGPEASGDGWRYRGAGAIQLTFANNHAACGRHFGIAGGATGVWLRSPEGACRSAAWFWSHNGINRWADALDFDGVCDMVNRGRKTAAMGDAIGWQERLAFFNTAMEVV
jgi:putative chitinase